MPISATAHGLEAFLALIMPAINGIEMAENILRIDPQAKILLMSGYSDNVIEKIRSLVQTSNSAASGT